MNNKILKETLISWLPLAVIIIIFSGLVYAAVCQNFRQDTYEQPIQIVHDVEDAILQGTPAESIVPPEGSLEITKSLSPFLMIFDGEKKLIGSSALLDGKNPEYPGDILEEAKKLGREHTVTWQPQPGIRMATVVKYYSSEEQSGYIVIGRSLQLVEKSIAKMTAMTAVAGGSALIITLLLIFVLKKIFGTSGLSSERHQHTEIVIDSTKEI